MHSFFDLFYVFIDVGQSVWGLLERVQIFSWLESLKIVFTFSSRRSSLTQTFVGIL